MYVHVYVFAYVTRFGKTPNMRCDVKPPFGTNVFLLMYVYFKRLVVVSCTFVWLRNVHLTLPIVRHILPVGAARRLLASDRPLLDQNLDYHWAVTSGRCYMQSGI